MNPLIQFRKSIALTFIVLLLACFALSQTAQAVLPSPTPDGGYPGGNTAEGRAALLSLTTGGYNTAVGFFSLRSDTTGSFNTAIGAGALDLNTADKNTATGAAALLLNTTGTNNTANGVDALVHNTTGNQNAATGFVALYSNTTGNDNVGSGYDALSSNTTGSFNIGLGPGAGDNLTTGSNNIDIGNFGVADEANTIRIGDEAVQTATYIAGISGQSASGGVAVFIDSDGKLGTLTSSGRFKNEIKPMDKASEAILALKPVTFRYKKNIDPKGAPQFGLVAEEVEKVNPDLVVRDKEGKPYTVRYDQVNAMLLNEFLKEHHKVKELESTVAKQEAAAARQGASMARQQKQIEALTAGLQKVSAQLEVSNPAPRTVLNNQ